MNTPERTSTDADRIQALLQWQRQLADQLAELWSRRDELNEAIARKETQARNIRELLQSEGYGVEGIVGNLRPPNGAVADAAYELIKDGGQPLYYKDLADRLIDAGLPIPGRDPQANLLSYVVRDQRFQRISRGTYALAEWGLRVKSSRRKARTHKPQHAARRS